MKTKKQKIHPLLERMGRIDRMERGTICRMRGRPHCNHQTWQNGRNVVRYVPAAAVKRLQEAINGYRLFLELAEEYADSCGLILRPEQVVPYVSQAPGGRFFVEALKRTSQRRYQFFCAVRPI